MDVDVACGAEFVQRAAAGIIAARPAYRDLIEFYAELFAAQEEARPRLSLEPFLLSPELVRIKRQEKFPLIQAEEMRFDPEASQGLFGILCRIAVDRGSGLSAAAQVLRTRSEDTPSLFKGFLGGDEALLGRSSAEFGVDATALSFFLYHSLRPSICRCAESLSGFLVDEQAWEKGYCPVCGSPPVLAEVCEDGRRFLACSFCWHRWPARRVACPFCGNGDPGGLSYLYSEEEPEHRIELCDACRKYVKTIDSRNLSRPVYPPLEQVATLHLDLKAAESGYESAHSGCPAVPAAPA
jgi:FdhE protein